MTERNINREWNIVAAALLDLLEADSWTSAGTKEYIKEHMVPNVTRDWRENAPIEVGDWREG